MTPAISKLETQAFYITMLQILQVCFVHATVLHHDLKTGFYTHVTWPYTQDNYLSKVSNQCDHSVVKVR